MEFVSDFGPLGTWHDDFRGLPIRPELRIPGEMASLITDRHSLDDRDQRGEFIDEARYGLATLQLYVSCRQELEAPRFIPGRLARRWPATHAIWSPPASRAQAARFLVAGLNAAIPPVGLQAPDARQPLDVVLGHTPPSSLFQVCALELANHLLKDGRFRRCKNEQCPKPGGLFTGRTASASGTGPISSSTAGRIASGSGTSGSTESGTRTPDVSAP